MGRWNKSAMGYGEMGLGKIGLGRWVSAVGGLRDEGAGWQAREKKMRGEREREREREKRKCFFNERSVIKKYFFFYSFKL